MINIINAIDFLQGMIIALIINLIPFWLHLFVTEHIFTLISFPFTLGGGMSYVEGGKCPGGKVSGGRCPTPVVVVVYVSSQLSYVCVMTCFSERWVVRVVGLDWLQFSMFSRHSTSNTHLCLQSSSRSSRWKSCSMSWRSHTEDCLYCQLSRCAELLYWMIELNSCSLSI